MGLLPQPSVAATRRPGDTRLHVYTSVDTGPFATDARGNVSTTLNTGSAGGTISIEVTCRELSALVSVIAGAVAETPAAPPASLPDTDAGRRPEARTGSSGGS